MAIRYKNEIIIIDAGMMIPDAEMLGIKKIIPNFKYLKKNKKLIKGLVITHAHEDHIGALPYLFQEINTPIYATKLTLGLARNRLKYKNLANQTNFIEIKPKEKIKIGTAFEIEPISVCHSIPDSVALAIKTDVGTIIHSGDFRIDPTPVDNVKTDLNRFKELGKKKVLLLMSDSTNANLNGKSSSEKDVGKFFLSVFKKAKSKIIVSSFSSHIHRIQMVINAAEKLNKKVSIVGKSMVDTVNIALKLGYINFPPNTKIPAEQISRYQPNELVILTTGTQGELNSALCRLSENDYRDLKINKGDTVIISAHAIPGNEKFVNKTIDNLFRRGADVYYDINENIHISGHAFKNDQKLLLNLVKPKFFVPIHGDYRHLLCHTKTALEAHVKKENIFIMENGDILEILETGQKAHIAGKMGSSSKLIDGISFVEPNNKIIGQRKDLSRNGTLAVSCLYNKISFEVIESPKITSWGLIYDEEKHLIEDLPEFITAKFSQATKTEGFDQKNIEKKLKENISNYIYNKLKRRPVICLLFQAI